MIGFLASVNGENCFLAAFEGDGSLTVFLEKPIDSPVIELEATGLENLANGNERFLRWKKVAINEGDEVRFLVVDTQLADVPMSEILRTSAEKAKQKEGS